MKEKVWVDTGNGSGYWSTSKGTNSTKLDFFCAHCKRITGTIDDKYLREYGICSVCYVNYVEDRQTPAIDLTPYKK